MTPRRRRPKLLRRVAAARRRKGSRPPDRALLRAERQRVQADELAHHRAARDRYRRLGTARGQRRRFAGRVLWTPQPPPFEASTAALEAVYPFQTTSMAGSSQAAGIAVGPSPIGGTFTWDPWTLYRAGQLSNPNVLILGDVGSGKSSLAKTLVWRGLEFGRGAHIIDPKGEYAPLADAVGVEPIALRPGGGTVLNPLDPGAAGRQVAPTDLFHRNVATVRALLDATLGRPCRQLEMVLVTAALARVSGLQLRGAPDGRPSVADHGQTATLPMLADALVDPPADVARRVNMDPARVVEESREMALALARLVDDHGDLGGMFAGHTTLDADARGDLTVVDLTDVYRSHRVALPMVMICTAAWLQLACAISPRGRFQVNDEAWALLSDEASARWMQTNQKLSRQLSLSVVNVMHRLSDSAAAGEAGSATRSLAEGVITDSGTWIIYRQKPSERRLLQRTLQLNDLQTHLATQLGRGRALWDVAGETRKIALVDHTLSEAEWKLVDTDAGMNAGWRQTPDRRHERAREPAAAAVRPADDRRGQLPRTALGAARARCRRDRDRGEPDRVGRPAGRGMACPPPLGGVGVGDAPGTARPAGRRAARRDHPGRGGSMAPNSCRRPVDDAARGRDGAGAPGVGAVAGRLAPPATHPRPARLPRLGPPSRPHTPARTSTPSRQRRIPGGRPSVGRHAPRPGRARAEVDVGDGGRPHPDGEVHPAGCPQPAALGRPRRRHVRQAGRVRPHRPPPQRPRAGRTVRPHRRHRPAIGPLVAAAVGHHLPRRHQDRHLVGRRRGSRGPPRGRQVLGNPGQWTTVDLPEAVADELDMQRADLADPHDRRRVLPHLLETGPADLVATIVTFPQLQAEWPHLDLADILRQAWEASYPSLADDIEWLHPALNR